MTNGSQRSGLLRGTYGSEVHVGGDIDLPKAIPTTHCFVINSDMVVEVLNRVLNEFRRASWFSSRLMLAGAVLHNDQMSVVFGISDPLCWIVGHIRTEFNTYRGDVRAAVATHAFGLRCR